MADASADAIELARLLQRMLASSTAANDQSAPEWVLLPSEAKRRGFSTRQFRAWCMKRGVPLREGNHRETWVRPLDVNRAVEGLPLAKPPSSVEDDIDADIRAARERRGER